MEFFDCENDNEKDVCYIKIQTQEGSDNYEAVILEDKELDSKKFGEIKENKSELIATLFLLKNNDLFSKSIDELKDEIIKLTLKQ